MIYNLISRPIAWICWRTERGVRRLKGIDPHRPEWGDCNPLVMWRWGIAMTLERLWRKITFQK